MADATVRQAIYAMGLDPSQYAQQAQIVERANQKILGSTAQVTQAEERVTAATRVTADGFAKLEARYDPLIRAEQRRQAALAQANRYLEQGAIANDRHMAQVQRINAFYDQQVVQLNRLRGVNDNAATGMARFRGTIQQAGFQIGDFATQVASGGNALVALTQQSGQLLGAFGVWGAVLGAAASVAGAVAIKVFDMGDATQAAKKAAEEAEKAQDAYNQVLLTSSENADLAAAKARGVAIALTEEAIARNKATAATVDQLRVNQLALEQELQFYERRPDAEAFRNVIDQRRRELKELNDEIAAAVAARDDVDALEDRLSRLRDPNQSGAAREAAAEAQKKAAEDAREAADDLEKTRRDFNNFLDDMVRKQDEADAKRNVSVEKYIESLENAGEIEKLSGVEKEIQRATIEAQNKLIDEQGRKVRDLTDAERERIANAVRLNDEAEKQRQAQEKAAKDAARDAQRTLDSVVDYGGDLFADLFRNTKGGWKEIWKDMEDTAKGTLARLAAEMILRPIIAPIINGVYGASPGATGSLPGVGAPPGASSGLSGMGAMFGNSPFSLGTLGSSIGSIFGGSGGAGAGISGAVGAVPVWGWIALAASIAKGFVEGSDPRSAKGVFNTLLGPSMEEWQANPWRSATIASNPIATALGDLSGSKTIAAILNPLSLFGPGKPNPASHTGIRVDSQGRLVVGESASKHVDDSVSRDPATQIVSTFNELFASLGLRATAQSDTYIKYDPGRSEVEKGPEDAIRDIIRGASSGNRELDRLIDRLPGGSAEKMAQNLADLVTTFRAIDNFKNPTSEVIDAFQAINDQFDKMAANARRFGLDVGAVEQMRQQALEQQRMSFAQPFYQAAGGIVDFLNAQSLSATSSLSPTERLTQAQRQFGDLLERVRGGEVGLTGSLTQAAGTLLGMGRDQFASSVSFAALERSVRDSLLSVSELFTSDSFIDKQIEATKQQTAELSNGLTEIREAVKDLKREIQLMRQEAA